MTAETFGLKELTTFSPVAGRTFRVKFIDIHQPDTTLDILAAARQIGP